MDIQEIKKQGLKHEYKLTIPAKHFDHLVEQELKHIGEGVSLPGFRKGKVPLNVLEQRYGADARKEALEKAMQEASKKLFQEKKLVPALNPKFAIEQYKPGQDLVLNMYFEVLPEVKIHDLKEFPLNHHKAKVADSHVSDYLNRLARDQHSATVPLKKARPTQMGDVVVIDFAGELHGKNIPNATAQDFELHLGSRSFVDNFEDQLVGKKVGDRVLVHVNFPADYHGKELAGQHVHFDVTIKEIKEAVPVAVDDDLATKVGFKDLTHLKETVEKHLQAEFDRTAWSLLKQNILNAFSDRYDFPIPEQMVEMEMEAIIEQLTDGENHGHKPTEEQLKAWKEEGLPIAERRVRLGLVLAEIANQNNIDVSSKELSDAILHHARSYPGQEKQVVDYFKNDANARASLRGPILEGKVIDFIINHLPLTVKEVSYEEMNKLVHEAQETQSSGTGAKSKKKTSKK